MEPTSYPQLTEFEQLGEKIKTLGDYLLSDQLQEHLFLLKISFIVVSIFFFFAILYFLFKTEYLKEWFWFDLKNFFFPKKLIEKKLAKKWAKIKKDLRKSQLEAQWKLALMEGVELFDERLKKMGYPGENLIERLEKLTPEELPDLEKIIWAAKICQDIARDPSYKLTKKEAQKVLAIFEKTLVEFGIL